MKDSTTYEHLRFPEGTRIRILPEIADWTRRIPQYEIDTVLQGEAAQSSLFLAEKEGIATQGILYTGSHYPISLEVQRSYVPAIVEGKSYYIPEIYVEYA